MSLSAMSSVPMPCGSTCEEAPEDARGRAEERRPGERAAVRPRAASRKRNGKGRLLRRGGSERGWNERKKRILL